MNGRVWAFAIYSILYELIIWFIFGYAVFIEGYSGWWFTLAVYMSCHQLKPNYFNIPFNKDNVK